MLDWTWIKDNITRDLQKFLKMMNKYVFYI